MKKKDKNLDIKVSASAYFSLIKSNRRKLLRKHGNALSFCRKLISDPSAVDSSKSTLSLFTSANVDDRHYLIGSTYALLIGDQRRRELSAYFTPPALAAAAICAGAPFLDAKKHPTILDPACGGGSFLTPITRYLVEKNRKQGASIREACDCALRDIQGIELDPGLAALSQALLKDMLKHTYDYKPESKRKIVRCQNTLFASSTQLYDLVIGNPPYGKIGADAEDALLTKAGLADIGGHTNLYSLFLLRSLDWVKPNGGLVFVLPTSFVAGPYFAGLRQEIMTRADVLSIDLHEQRENLFLGAVQDVCILTLRRVSSAVHTHRRTCIYKLGIIDSSGNRRQHGTAVASADGDAWTLPVAQRNESSFSQRKAGSNTKKDDAHVLADYGYRVRVGKVVPNRERERLHMKKERGDFPLVWASAIRPNGGFDFNVSGKLGNASWYCPSENGQLNVLPP